MALPVTVSFEARLSGAGLWPIRAARPTCLQLNLGYRCNLRCVHCHLDAGPHRSEAMSDEVLRAAVALAARAGIRAFDLTGGAPELHPGFRRLVLTLRARGDDVIDRCNLAILSEPGQEDLADFLAAHGVRVHASLPHPGREMTDRVRGRGTHARLIDGLRRLNAVGYGRPGGPLELTLVYNPPGALLPASQSSLEADFRAELQRQHGVVFTRLVALTNLPTGRFLAFLERSGNAAAYLARLEAQFNPATLAGVMCRSLLSVGWDGTLYDCDFNQALGIAIGNGVPLRVQDVDIETLVGRPIRCRDHCYGCTAGQGSSCGGAVA